MDEQVDRKEILGTMQTVGVLIFNETNDKVLLVKHTKAAQNEEGIYGIPAGKIEPTFSESPKEAAVRELVEETGLVAREEDLEQFENNFFGDDIVRTKTGEVRHGHMRVFHCKKYEGLVKDDEKTIPEWVDVREVEKWAEEDKKKNGIWEADEKKENWSKRKLMPNVANAIDNYLQTIQPQE